MIQIEGATTSEKYYNGGEKMVYEVWGGSSSSRFGVGSISHDNLTIISEDDFLKIEENSTVSSSVKWWNKVRAGGLTKKPVAIIGLPRDIHSSIRKNTFEYLDDNKIKFHMAASACGKYVGIAFYTNKAYSLFKLRFGEIDGTYFDDFPDQGPVMNSGNILGSSF